MTDHGAPPRSLLVGGGVSANRLLRHRCQEMEGPWALTVCLPQPALCVDNGAMIAGLAFEHHLNGRSDPLDLCAYASSDIGVSPEAHSPR